MKIKASTAMVTLVAVTITFALGNLGGLDNVEAKKDCENRPLASGPTGNPHTSTQCTGDPHDDIFNPLKVIHITINEI